MRSELLASAQEIAVRGGLNLFGLVDASRFDGCSPCEQRFASRHPRCGTLVVLGSGGRAFWQQYAASFASGASADGQDLYTAATVRAVVARLHEGGVACESVLLAASPKVNANRLGECAGFGTVSPVSGLLVHPEFGPWVRVRAALLLDGRPFGVVPDAAISDRYQPCCSCSKPCVTACPAGVHDGRGNQDLGACASHRHDGGCEHVCASRLACPVGSQHRDEAGEDAHRHAFRLATMQRWFGFGVWRLVPTFLRHGR
ncbi:MAG: hypothetical protein JNL12_01110 [Planctomycetes bacterium]|nr:hypothetical protein [Planctomycetota bacterium]